MTVSGLATNEDLLRQLGSRLNEQLREYARSRAGDVARGLESAALGGLVVQKYGTGMAEAVAVLEQLLDARLPEPIAMDEATAMVDPAWRENAQARYKARADIDLSTPRAAGLR